MIYFTTELILDSMGQQQPEHRARSFEIKQTVEYLFAKARHHQPEATNNIMLIKKGTVLHSPYI